jgi:hypothetical protein
LLKKSFFALNDIFQDLGYSRYEEAKRAFLVHGDLFYENKDFEVFRISAENLNGNMPLNGNNGVGGRPQEIVKMTFECLLRFSMEVKSTKKAHKSGLLQRKQIQTSIYSALSE